MSIAPTVKTQTAHSVSNAVHKKISQPSLRLPPNWPPAWLAECRTRVAAVGVLACYDVDVFLVVPAYTGKAGIVPKTPADWFGRDSDGGGGDLVVATWWWRRVIASVAVATVAVATVAVAAVKAVTAVVAVWQEFEKYFLSVYRNLCRLDRKHCQKKSPPPPFLPS